jgi:hypothetical protein
MTMNANDLFNAVMQLDLEPIKMKLMHVQSGEGWSLEKANAVEKEYRRFLCLMKMYPDEDTAPLVDVDTFWHYHILDTMKYAKDCEQAFGYFLHHYPYVGMRGEDDEQFRIDSGNRMAELYEATFGEAYPATIEQPRGEGAWAATAYCAGPDSKAQGVAYCAGPDSRAATAYCAGPDSKRVSALRAGSAYCAGPDSKRASDLRSGTAYCAGPDSKRASALRTATAYCAGPDSKAASGNDIAYCAGPDIRAATAYCAGPDSKRASDLRSDTAYCAGPDSKRAALA